MFGRGTCAGRYVIGKRRVARKEKVCVVASNDGEMDHVTWLMKIMKK